MQISTEKKQNEWLLVGEDIFVFLHLRRSLCPDLVQKRLREQMVSNNGSTLICDLLFWKFMQILKLVNKYLTGSKSESWYISFQVGNFIAGAHNETVRFRCPSYRLPRFLVLKVASILTYVVLEKRVEECCYWVLFDFRKFECVKSGQYGKWSLSQGQGQ